MKEQRKKEREIMIDGSMQSTFFFLLCSGPLTETTHARLIRPFFLREREDNRSDYLG